YARKRKNTHFSWRLGSVAAFSRPIQLEDNSCVVTTRHSYLERALVPKSVHAELYLFYMIMD
ncbi:MAG: hypothetical protein JXA33_05670, partial [Anaerolineae bacterium]|nr:hypothetical protein [Anaerolineae bacterium]